MAFVPMPPVASERARDLGRRLAEEIEAYRREHPDLSRRDVRSALRLALSGSSGIDRPPVLALVAGVIALILGFVLALERQGGAGSGGLQIAPFVILIVLLVGWVLFVRLRG